MCPLFIIKSIMEEDNFHDPGIKHKRDVVNKYFSVLCYKIQDRYSNTLPKSKL